MTALVPTETAEATPAPPAATMLSVQGEGEAPKTMADMFLKSEVGLLVLAYYIEPYLGFRDTTIRSKCAHTPIPSTYATLIAG